MADPCFHHPFDLPPNPDPDPFFDADHLSFPPPLDGDFLSDLAFSDDFGIDVEFSLDDFLLLSPDRQGGPPEDPAPGASSDSSNDRGRSDPSPCSPESGNTSAASGVVDLESKVEEDEEKNNWSLKRKQGVKEEERGDARVGGDSLGCGSPRGSKLRRSDEVSSPSCVFSAGADDDDKRKVRLMRNRESAQLSRQRKKQYVDVLEEKVRSMHSTINELNAKISYVVAENVTLRQQLGAKGAGGVPTAVYPPPSGAIAPMHFPWIPGYALRPQGSQIPLVPIPRLKPQHPAPAPKVKRSENKKGENKTKKVASVSLLGLLCIMLIFGVVPGPNLGYEGNTNDVVSVKGRILTDYKGRILSVRGRRSGLNTTDEMRLCNGKGGVDRLTGRKCHNGNNSLSPTAANGSVFKQNTSETLPALLYVPRNGKHVKINGNLIIHSVLASERAMTRANKKQPSTKEETGLAIARNRIPSSFAFSQAGREADQHSNSYRMGPDDGPLQQWFREGMTGPILSSGICTEVFQFDVSPSSAYLGSVIPATTIINATKISNGSENLPPKSGSTGEIKNMPIPLAGATMNKTEQFGNSSENSKFQDTKPTSSMVVSVLADPREAGDGDNDGRVSPKPISRIFVVVLLDSVKYVTYSCVLPFKSSATIL